MSRSTLEQKKAMRLKFMNALYEETGDDEEVRVDPTKLAEAMNLRLPEQTWDNDDPNVLMYSSTVDYLVGEGLIRRMTKMPVSPIYITHKGIVEVEKALDNPYQSTEYFAPASMVINYIESVGAGAQIQQSGSGSTQSITIVDGATRRDIETLIARLGSEMEQLGLDAEERREVEAEIRTVKAQLSSPKPKVPITKTALQSIKNVLEGAAGSAAGTGLISAIEALINNLP